MPLIVALVINSGWHGPIKPYNGNINDVLRENGGTMTPKRDIVSWQSMADPAIVKEIGSSLKQMRLNKNISQMQLAKSSGLSRVTISRMESGRDVTIMTIVQVLRALGKLDILNAFHEDAQISPLQLLRMKKRERRRASSPRGTAKTKSNKGS